MATSEPVRGKIREDVNSVKFVLLGAALMCFPSLASATELTNSQCAAQIREGNRQRDGSTVPPSCWRFGPVAIGVNAIELQALLGDPDETWTNKYPLPPSVSQAYVLPRVTVSDFKKRVVPAANARPIVLTGTLSDGKVVSLSEMKPGISLDGVPSPAVANSRDSIDAVGYDFATVSPGDSLSDVEAKLGRWTYGSNGGDVLFYSPLPIKISAIDVSHADAIEISSEIRWVGVNSSPQLIAHLDAKTCQVTGFVLQ